MNGVSVTMTLPFLALHGLAVRKSGSAASVADLLGLPEEKVACALAEAVATGHAIEARGTYMVTPAGKAELHHGYPVQCDQLRRNGALAEAYGTFEALNRQLLNLFTDWQTVKVGPERVTNDHTDPDYDWKVLDRLDAVHLRADRVLERMAAVEPRLARYRERLEAAHQNVLAGNHDYVTGVQVPSYHTVWFELHEDLLRLLGRTREP